MQVGDILRQRSGTRIATVRMHETVATAEALMRSQDIEALVVKDVCRTEGNVAVGMISRRDLERAYAELGAGAGTLKVARLISIQRCPACRSSDTIGEVREQMQAHGVAHLPVIDDHTLIGTISLREIDRAARP